MAEVVRYINRFSTAGGNGTTNATSGANRAYSKASEWEAAEQTNLVADGDTHTVYCSGDSTVKDTALNISGWTTNSTHYITFAGNPSESNGRNFTRKWSDDYYIIGGSGFSSPLSIGSLAYTRIVGIQVLSAGGNSRSLISLSSADNTLVDSCKLKFDGSETGWNGVNGASGSDNYCVKNCLVEATGSGSSSFNGLRHSAGGGTIRWYNNTVVDSNRGLYALVASVVLAKNNLIYNCTDAYNGTFRAASDYNSTDNAETTGGANDRQSQTFSFENAGAGDYGLLLTDTGALNLGTNLELDAVCPVMDDNVGTSRPQGVAFDIGAFETLQSTFDAGSSVKFGGYRMKQFTVPLSRVGDGNYLADLVNQFLALNQNLSVVGVTSNWRKTSGRAEALLYTLIYREGGARHWAVSLQSTATSSAESLASDFFGFNPAFRPMYTTIVSPPNDQVNDKNLLVIYQSMNDFARLCLMDASPGAPYGGVGVGQFADMQDPLNANRADVLAVNLGNMSWPDGGVNLIFNNVDACPDASAACCFGGIAPCCEDAAPIAANPSPTIVELCAGCYPADLLTLSTSTTIPTQTTVPTTTQSTTATFPTTAAPITQPTAPTTDTTTTPPPCTSGVTWTGPSSGGVPKCALNNYTLIAGVPTITLYFNDCSLVFATYTYDGATWSVSGYPTTCPISIVNVRSNFLDCVGGTPDIELNVSLGSPCNVSPSDIIVVP